SWRATNGRPYIRNKAGMQFFDSLNKKCGVFSRWSKTKNVGADSISARSAAHRCTIFFSGAQRREPPHLLFIICEHEVSYNENILKQSPDQTRG
uniref:hypothetical protein n=1 Tax=Gemmiger formicilis TaxID=745368 RepID=UPI003FEE72C9